MNSYEIILESINFNFYDIILKIELFSEVITSDISYQYYCFFFSFEQIDISMNSRVFHTKHMRLTIIQFFPKFYDKFFLYLLDGEPSHLSTSQRKNYDFNASIVRRIHELDAELTQAKVMYEKKIESVMTDYNEALQIAKHMETPSSLSKNLKVQLSDRNPIPLISSSHEYSLQPNLLNALREAESFNEAFEEVVDPVGSIVPNKLMNIERPPYKRTSERRRYHRLFVRRTPKLRMFPR